ncbi:MAG: bifunctional adenosylcobinamide kinase/adenosylcobinamide-phosphate guanylyltransferase [Lentisphaerae bacterium GWF2_38_69]|nr:MAG: bifunctional adenosylcobinamide kinase/adenosylcobinamide-phosphate guanylyltransferase [Lentisphaerae bacterium GWF2_38_69]
MKKNNKYLLTGGVRSGKSSYAVELARSCKSPFYIATGWAGDEEMTDRIIKHKEERDSRWLTIEERYNLDNAILEAIGKGADMIVVDCITMWTCNLMYAEKDNMNSRVNSLLEGLIKVDIPIVLVTNEVGLGIVPETKDGRNFRDQLGQINQKLAKVCDKVIFMVSGIPMEIK